MSGITLKQLSEMLGVSTATVSFALNDSSQVSEATRRKIQRFAAAHGYRPNHFGRALQAQRAKLAGFVTRAVTTSFFGALLQGAGYEAARHRYGLIAGLVNSDNDLALGEELEHTVQTMLDKTVDGILFAVEAVNLEPYHDLFARARLPVVFCSLPAFGRYTEVLTDDVAGGEMAAGYLLARGRRRLLCCELEPRRFAGNRRAVAACADAKLQAFTEVPEALDLLDRQPDIDGVCCYCDLHAVEIIRSLRARGRRVPEEVAVVGYDGMFYAQWPEFNFPTVIQPQTELGQRAFVELRARIEGRTAARETILLRPTLAVPDEGAAPPRKRRTRLSVNKETP